MLAPLLVISRGETSLQVLRNEFELTVAIAGSMPGFGVASRAGEISHRCKLILRRLRVLRYALLCRLRKQVERLSMEWVAQRSE